MTKIRRALARIDPALSAYAQPAIAAIALLGIVAVGVPDYLVGTEISLSVFYLCPVGIATWYAGRSVGAAIAVISIIPAIAADVAANHLLIRPGIVAWSVFLHLAFMLTVSQLLDSLRGHIESERALARSDPVTGILNRRAFVEQLQERLNLSARERQPLSLAFVDLDDFKRINDRGGHAEGDRVLRLVAGTLAASVRRTDVAARLGGDEFALLLTGADREGAERTIEKLRASLRAAFHGDSSPVTCSIGCVTFQGTLPTADAAIGAADVLMYTVKKNGKNAVAFDLAVNKEAAALRRPG